MEVKKILWPTDFSPNAEKALEYVTSLSEKYHTEVHVLYVIQELAQHAPWYGDFDRSHFDKIQEWEKKTARKRLDEICEKYLQGCPLYIKHIASGDPAQEILKLIKQEGINMVVMASHGARAHFRFGGVAEKVLKYSPAPVVLVPIEPEGGR